MVPVIVSSDAHDPSWVGRVDLAMELLEEIDLPESLILNLEAERLLRFCSLEGIQMTGLKSSAGVISLRIK